MKFPKINIRIQKKYMKKIRWRYLCSENYKMQFS